MNLENWLIWDLGLLTPIEHHSTHSPNLKLKIGKIKKAEPLITDLEKNRNNKALTRMALNLKDLSDVIGTESVFILEKKKDVDCIDGVPVVHNWEIGEMKNPAEFLKMLAERRECN